MIVTNNFKHFLNDEEISSSELTTYIGFKGVENFDVLINGFNIHYYERTTSSETQIDDKKEGVKHNKYKPQLDLIQTVQFPKALQLITLASMFGHNKYKDTDKDYLNFKRLEGGIQNFFDAASRHNLNRNELDSESNLPHIVHTAWNYMAALEIWVDKNIENIEDYTKKYLKNLHN